MELKYTDNIWEWTQKLRRAGVALQEAGALACTNAAKFIATQYRLELQMKTIHLRNKAFTLKSVVVFPAKARRSSGDLRPMSNINAIVGVRKIGGNREHYLALLEIGADKKGVPELGGKVGIPLDSARSGEDRNRAVASIYRFTKGYNIGGKVDLSRFSGNPRQQFAIMNSMARRGKLWGEMKNKQISKHMLYRVDYGAGQEYLFAIRGKKARIVRDLSKSFVDIPSKPWFGEAVDMLTSGEMQGFFSRAANDLI